MWPIKNKWTLKGLLVVQLLRNLYKTVSTTRSTSYYADLTSHAEEITRKLKHTWTKTCRCPNHQFTELIFETSEQLIVSQPQPLPLSPITCTPLLPAVQGVGAGPAPTPNHYPLSPLTSRSATDFASSANLESRSSVPCRDCRLTTRILSIAEIFTPFILSLHSCVNCSLKCCGC